MNQPSLSNYSARQLGDFITDPLEGYDMPQNGGQQMAADLLDNGNEADEELARAIGLFFEDLIADLEQLRNYATQKQTQRNLVARLDRNDRRLKNIPSLQTDDNGDVDETSQDGHLQLGVSMGLMPTAINVASSYINGQYHERAERFYSFRPIGLTEEGKSLGLALEHFVDWHMNEADFESESRRRSLCYCKNGTAVMRMEFVSKTRFERSPDTGQWFETPGEIMPRWTLWPLRHVIPISFSEPDSRKWEGVFWMRPNASLAEIEADEAIYEPQVDELTGEPIANFRVEGKFFGLKRLRTADLGGNKSQSAQWDTINVLADAVDNLHNSASFNLCEWEGSIAYEVFLRADPRVLSWFGINVGLPEVDPEDQDGRRELAARLARIKHWWVAYIVPGSLEAGIDASTDGRMAIGFDALELGRHTAYVHRYQESSEKELYGDGICDRGDGPERIHDALRNAQMRIGVHNSKPSGVIDASLTQEKTVREIEKLLRPGNLVEKMSGKKLDEMIELLMLKADPNMQLWIQAAENSFWQVVGVPKSLVGYAGADTLGQDQLNVQQGKNQLDDVILRNSREDYRMIRDMIEGLWKSLGPQAFMARLRKVAGLYGVELEQDIATTDEIWREYRIEHPASFGKDPVVLGMQIDQMAQIYPGIYDQTMLALASAAAKGVLGAESMLAAGWPVLSPEEEEKQMALGHRISPSARMDPATLIEHIQAHIVAMEQIEAGVSKVPQKQWQTLHDALDRYLQTAMLLLQAFMGPLGGMLAQNGQSAGPRALAGPAQQKALPAPGGGERTAKQGADMKAKGVPGGNGSRNPVERAA